ncbi:hypothetical protein Glove_209g4 [Diversispora epigaea]|uniref:C2H2-type domain-containing protein n=1 Tax=Diversispora epigaea TaxID=1348612 RepID=A0A397ISX8_9GLOM|nr:hypothetical protein Glove_209g4 [Diversispora epigaea]
MSWKCDFCPQRIFITKTSYTNHIKRCFESVDSSEELSLENNFESIHENSNEDEDEDEDKDEDEDDDSNNAKAEEESLTSNISHSSVLFFENMELSNSDVENYSFNNYASDNNNICKEAEPIEFPNNAYADLMALVTNYNLFNEATNAVIHFFNEYFNLPLSPLPKNAKKGRELMEKMKIPTLTSKKHKILTHNNIDYYLFYHPVLNCIKNILSISDISQNFTLRFKNFKYKGEKAYSEQYTGNWWKNTEASLPDGSKLLSIILYSNATTTDTLSKSSLHPIYISIGNISTKRRNKSDAKQLLGYLPILKAKDKFEKKSKDFKKLVRLTFYNSMKFLLDFLFAKKGIDLEVDNETYWFFPRISTIICDWPEATTFNLVYKSTNSNFPCHFCLISKTLLSNTDLSDITFRNNENMQEYFYNDAGQDVSLENISNYFCSLVDKIDDRLSKIPRFQKFQMFTNGLQSISRMTAKEYRILMKVMVFVVDNLYEENKNNVEDFVENRKLSEVYAKWNKIMTAKEYRILMKVMVFVVDNLYEENKNNVEDFVENRKLSEVYAKWNKMYMMSRSEIFTESDLENFQNSYNKSDHKVDCPSQGEQVYQIL